jgi:hypothetical protein
VFDDIIQPREEFYGGDDNPIEFECEFEIDEDANVSYSFSDLEEALKIDDEALEKAIDDAMKELFGDDCCDTDDGCSDCRPVPEPDYGQDETCDCGSSCKKCSLVSETHTCYDGCDCEDDETVSERPKAWGI